jgi:hypothetical protein
LEVTYTHKEEQVKYPTLVLCYYSLYFYRQC